MTTPTALTKPLAIHSGAAWNAAWIAYCREHAIPHRIVDCLDSSVLDQIRDCSALMWHFHHLLPEDMLVARSVLNAAERMGLRVFPGFDSNWHFDDKLAQKYLFEALQLPAPPSWAFFRKEDALRFVATCPLPIVAKLRRGAGSYNVRLLHTRTQARRYVRRMFGRGYSPSPQPLADIRTKTRVAAAGGWRGIVRRLRKAPRFFRVVLRGRRFFGREKGYVYFQKFLADNECDVRISVVGNRAWGFRRMTRKGDFRASGSGVIDYDTRQIPGDLVKMSFDAARRLRMGSVCFDWVRDPEQGYGIVEISLGFVDDAVYACPGYWDRDLVWHTEHKRPSTAAIEDFLCAIVEGEDNA